jgi:hypothetical protein
MSQGFGGNFEGIGSREIVHWREKYERGMHFRTRPELLIRLQADGGTNSLKALGTLHEVDR